MSLAPKETVTPPKFTLEFVSELLAILVKVLEPPDIVLLVNVWVAVNNANTAYANLKLEGNSIINRISGNERLKIDANGNTLIRESDIEGSASSTVALQIGNATNNDVIHSRNKTSSGAVYHLFM